MPEALQRLQLVPAAILLTHHHHDHVDGVAQIVAQYPGLAVYGPQETADKGANHIVRDGDTFNIDGRQYRTLAVPGHTLAMWHSIVPLSVLRRHNVLCRLRQAV